MLSWPIDWWAYSQHPADTIGMSAFALLNLGYLSIAALGFKRHPRWAAGWRPLMWSMVAFVALRAALLLTLDNSEPRYTLEFYPVLTLLGAPMLAGLGRTRRSMPSPSTNTSRI